MTAGPAAGSDRKAAGGPPAPVVTVDGPSGTGKGTLCRALAARFGWHQLDSGALYRLVGLAAERRGLDLDDEPRVAALAGALDVEFAGERVLLDGREVGPELRTEAVGALASRVAALPRVRAALLERQRAFRQPPGLVADGRDMGTVVFPDAGLKIFLTASARARALRRLKQLNEQGLDVNLDELGEEIAARDRRDSERTVAPLRPAPDATVLDTTELGIEAVFERIARLVEERILTN